MKTIVFSQGTATNVRPTPSTEFRSIETISQRVGFLFLKTVKNSKNETWYEVQLPTGIGYVMNRVSVLRTVEHPYKNMIVEDSVAPYTAPSRDTITVSFSSEMRNEYIPLMNEIDAPIGIKMLATVMAQKEGFVKGTRSYRFNNPGNIGNTDSGKNKGFPSLNAGILFQIEFLTKIAEGKNRNFPLNKAVFLRPYYSPEIAKNQKTYQLEPYCPGYRFTYTGQLDQFIKIYATGARQRNTYLSLIRSYFKNMGYSITDRTTLQELLEL